MGNTLVRSFVFQPPPPSIEPRLLSECRVLPTTRGYAVPYLHVRVPRARHVLVYSHGNSEDISTVHAWCRRLASTLRVDVVVYDYCGYGVRNDHVAPCEDNVLADALDVVDYAASYAAPRGMRVVAFGRSLGSAPSIHAAASRPDVVDALIVESGFTSCVKTQLSTPFTFWFDLFRNEDVLPSCPQPTMVVHGTDDVVVPFAHGQRLQAIAVANGTAWCPRRGSDDGIWFEGAGHNDIDIGTNADELIHRLRHFLSACLAPDAVTAGPHRRRCGP